MLQFLRGDSVSRAFRASVTLKLDRLLTQASALLAQGQTLMAEIGSVKQLISDINDETNGVAAKIDTQTAAIVALQAKVDAGGAVEASDLDDLVAGLQPISDRLKALGSDPEAPIPPVAPATTGDSTAGE